MKRREEVVAMVAHDLRNPLGVIKLNTELLLENEMQVSGTARRWLESTMRSIVQSNRIIENLLVDARDLLVVRDQGPGITAEALPHLFERFWQQAGAGVAGVGYRFELVELHVPPLRERVW